MSVNDCHIIKGAHNGPITCIAGSIHGDETIGYDVINWLKDRITPESLHGELRLIFGNPKAFEKGTRFIDTDLNRLFDDPNLTRIRTLDENERNIEEKRALEVIKHFNGADYLLDIHATGKPTRYPFIYCANTPQHIDIAKLFDVDIVVTESVKTNMSDGPTDVYVDRHGGLGFTLEAGWVGESSLLETVKHDTLRFLNHIGAHPNDVTVPSKHASHITIVAELIAQTDDFAFAGAYPNMHQFKMGDLIARDGKDIIADKDYILIFPKRVIQKGKETGYLALKQG